MTASRSDRPCKDCASEGVTTRRPAPNPGPRCASHHRAVRRQRSARQHGRHIDKTYGITIEEYTALFVAQGGACAICQRAYGKTKRLCVDHEHNKPGCDHLPETGCRNCINGLTCNTCNRIVLGRYDVDSLARAIMYMLDPPARKVL